MRKYKLVKARKVEGFSQEYLAGLLGISASNYSRKESGAIRITSPEWKKIAELLKVPVEDIYEAEERKLRN